MPPAKRKQTMLSGKLYFYARSNEFTVQVTTETRRFFSVLNDKKIPQ